MLIKIVVDSQEIEFEAGWDALESLIERLPDDDPALAEAYGLLARSPVARIRQAVAAKDAVADEVVETLAADPCPEVIQALVNCQRRRISEPALREIIARNWANVNRDLAGSVEDCYQADPTAIAALLAQSADPSVRGAVAGNSNAPRVVVRQLVNDPEGEVRRLARATLAGRY